MAVDVSRYTGQDGTYKKLQLALLGGYLDGKPDTPEWRQLFQEQPKIGVMIGKSCSAPSDYTPVECDGRIIPLWALLDYAALVSKDPSVKQHVFRGRTMLPSLDAILRNIQ